MQTDPHTIRLTLEAEIAKSEAKTAEHKQKLAELAAQLCGQKPRKPKPRRDLGDVVNLQILGPKPAVAKTVESRIAFAKLQDVFRSVIPDNGKERFIGFLDRDHTLTWIRNISDINVLFRNYFLRGLHTLDLQEIPRDAIKHVNRLDLTPILNYGDSKLVFRGQFRPGEALVLLYFEKTWGIEKSLEHCRKIVPNLGSLTLADDVGDFVAIDSEEAWTYATATAQTMAGNGLAPLLIF
jgi:hypothetical protein